MEKARAYSGLFIITPDKEETLSEVKDAISVVIKENSGSVVKEMLTDKKKFAYPIKKKGEGIYYEVIFAAPPASLAEMMRQFRINTDILRTLIDRTELETEGE